MEIFLKEEAFVLNRKFIGNQDALITVYTQKLGVENIFIPNGQLIKNLPYVYLDKFTYIEAVFQKYREDKVYIVDIDRTITYGLKISTNPECFYRLTDVSGLLYRYAPYPDKMIFNLYKKTILYCVKTMEVYKYYLAFLVKFSYLLGVYDLKDIGPYRQMFISVLNTPLREIAKLDVVREESEKLSAKVIHNMNRWLD